MTSHNIFYILAFVLAAALIGYDHLLFVNDEWQEAFRDTVYYVALFGVFSYLYIDKTKQYKSKFEKRTLLSILVVVILYKILIILIAFISSPNDYYQYRVLMNSYIYDTIQVVFFILVLSVNVIRWLFTLKPGKRIWHSFLR